MLGVVLVVVGLTVAGMAPVYVNQKFEEDEAAYLKAVISDAGDVARGGTWTWSETQGWKEVEGDIVRPDPRRQAVLRQGRPRLLSYWPGVIAGGAAVAVGILVLAITLAGPRREKQEKP